MSSQRVSPRTRPALRPRGDRAGRRLADSEATSLGKRAPISVRRVAVVRQAATTTGFRSANGTPSSRPLS
jgi:hypothetical protein